MNEEISNFLRKQAGERFLRYVRINTQSDPDSKMHPSSEGQWVLGRLLREELIELGNPPFISVVGCRTRCPLLWLRFAAAFDRFCRTRHHILFPSRHLTIGVRR